MPRDAGLQTRSPEPEVRAAADAALLPSLAIGCLAAILVGSRLRLAAGLAAGIGSYLLLQSGGAWRARRQIVEREAALDETLEESFPSSDPPSFSGATA